MDYYVYIKSLHIIFVVAWFAALFYMPRLLIYHTEAQLKPDPDKTILGDQFKIMQRRLWYGIAWPAMILTWIFGLWMLFVNLSAASDGLANSLLLEAWFVLKLIFVCALSLYHIQTQIIFQRQQKDIFRMTSLQLRLWNEVPTVFLFIIIFLVVPKKNTGWVWGTLAVIILIGAILAGIAIYKHSREKKEKPDALPPPNSTPPPPPPAV